MEFLSRAVAYVHNSRAEAVDDHWDEVRSTIELADDVPDVALRGLDAFSHVQVIFVASLGSDVPPGPWHRHPRNDKRWPDVGVFAQRNKDRPNRLLVSIANVERVNPRSLEVRGLDAIEATPVLDIKPVFSWGGPRGTLRVAPWSDELGSRYF